MENVVIMGCACVIISSLTPEQIERTERLAPEALMLDGYSIGLDDGPGAVGDDGALFSRTKSADGKATITLLVDPEIEDKAARVQNKIGPMLLKIEALEKQILEQEGDLLKKEKEIQSMINQM